MTCTFKGSILHKNGEKNEKKERKKEIKFTGMIYKSYKIFCKPQYVLENESTPLKTCKNAISKLINEIFSYIGLIQLQKLQLTPTKQGSEGTSAVSGKLNS